MKLAIEFRGFTRFKTGDFPWQPVKLPEGIPFYNCVLSRACLIIWGTPVPSPKPTFHQQNMT
jgi:hypothetical protein